MEKTIENIFNKVQEVAAQFAPEVVEVTYKTIHFICLHHVLMHLMAVILCGTLSYLSFKKLKYYWQAEEKPYGEEREILIAFSGVSTFVLAVIALGNFSFLVEAKYIAGLIDPRMYLVYQVIN